jgi:tetratricopeptide (TPR) repeat protein
VKLKKIVYLLAAILLVPALVLGAVLIISNQPLSPESPRTYFLAGNALYQKEDYASALMNYERAVKLDPNYEEALSNLALTYNKLEMYSVAAGVLKQLAEEHPGKVAYHYDYAINLILNIQKDNKGSIEEITDALAHFKKAEELSPGYLSVRENIAFLEDLQAQYYAK